MASFFLISLPPFKEFNWIFSRKEYAFDMPNVDAPNILSRFVKKKKTVCLIIGYFYFFYTFLW